MKQTKKNHAGSRGKKRVPVLKTWLALEIEL